MRYKKLTAYNRSLPALLICLAFLIACTREQGQGEDVIAQVNEAKLTRAELETSVPRGISSEQRAALKRDLMEKWIEDQIYYQTAVDDGFSLSAEEKKLLERYERRLLVQKFLDARINRTYKVNDQEIVDYYDQHKDEFIWKTEHAHIVHVLVENRDKALFTQIRKSKDLMSIIKTYFLDQQSNTAKPVGDLGYVKLSEFPDKVAGEIRKLRTGSISKPIRTEFGYHFVQLLDLPKVGDHKDLDLVRDEIRSRIQLLKRRQGMRALKRQLLTNFKIQTDLTKLNQP